MGVWGHVELRLSRSEIAASASAEGQHPGRVRRRRQAGVLPERGAWLRDQSARACGSATRLCLTAQTLTHFAPRVLVTPKEFTCNEGTIAWRRCRSSRTAGLAIMRRLRRIRRCKGGRFIFTIIESDAFSCEIDGTDACISPFTRLLRMPGKIGGSCRKRAHRCHSRQKFGQHPITISSISFIGVPLS